MPTVLEVSDLSVGFNVSDRYLPAVRRVSFSIEEGETLGLVGESGCGKSVTSLAVTRLLPKPAGVSGGVRFLNKELMELSERDMQHIRGNDLSMIFQEPMTSLNPVYKIGSQISEILMLHMNDTPRQVFSQSMEMLNKVGLPRPAEIMHAYPHELSGGMRQRVMIAIAMACNPKLLIADEPTTALDVTIQAQILELMKSITSDLGTSLLLITHDLGVVAEMCDRVAVMYAGEIVEQSTVDEIFFHAQHPYTRGLMDAIPRLDAPPKERLNPIDGNVPSITKMPHGCRFSARCPHVMNKCFTDAPELLEVDTAHWSRCWLYEGGVKP